MGSGLSFRRDSSRLPGAKAGGHGLHFGRALVLFGVLASGISIVASATILRHSDLGFDANWYHIMANQIATGRGYVMPFIADRDVPTAAFPPLYPLALSAVSFVGFTSVLAHEVWSSVFVGGAVVAIGILGRRLVNARVGLIAAALGAIYPMILASAAGVMSESLYLTIVATTFVVLVSAVERPGLWRWTAVGALVGAAALTRGEAILLVPFVVLPSLGLLWNTPPRRKLLAAGLVTLAAAAVMLPWIARNSVRFHTLVLTSTKFWNCRGRRELRLDVVR